MNGEHITIAFSKGIHNYVFSWDGVGNLRWFFEQILNVEGITYNEAVVLATMMKHMLNSKREALMLEIKELAAMKSKGNTDHPHWRFF